MKQPQEGPVCPAEITLSIVGGKWKPLIVWYLLGGTKRFGELRRLIPGATQQMLTLQLRELEQAGVLHRQVIKESFHQGSQPIGLGGRGVQHFLMVEHSLG